MVSGAWRTAWAWALAVAGAVVLLLVVGRAWGAYAVFEDFEGLELGPVGGQNGWVAAGLGAEVVQRPGDGGNQSLEVVVDTGVLHKPLLVPAGESRVLFMRFRFEGQHNYSLGMSHLSWPTEFSDFGPELRKAAAQDELKIHDGQVYRDVAVLSPGVWYQLWAWVDNAAGTTRLWLHDRAWGSARPVDALASDGQEAFGFRTDSGNDLVRFYLKAAEGGSGRDPLWLDDLYLGTAGVGALVNPTLGPLGDVSGDGFIGGADLDLLLGLWNQAVAAGTAEDLTGDGFIGAGDLDVLLSHWNLGDPSVITSAAVPQPGAAAVWALAGAWLGLRRRRLAR